MLKVQLFHGPLGLFFLYYMLSFQLIFDSTQLLLFLQGLLLYLLPLLRTHILVSPCSFLSFFNELLVLELLLFQLCFK